MQLKAEARNAPADKRYDIFLSHCFRDAEVVLALCNLIVELGFTVYVDWLEDPGDRERVTAETAAILRQRMRNSESFIYATSEASQDSKWMPWELGFYDGIKGRVAVMPICPGRTQSRDYEGHEYLGLYPYVLVGEIANTTKRTLWLHTRPDTYVIYEAWMKGTRPYRRV